MAIDLTRGAAGAGYAPPPLDLVVDTAETNRTAADVLECLHIKAGTFVLLVGLEIITKEGGTMTLDVGDGANTDGYLDGVNGNTGTVPVWYASNNDWTVDVTNQDMEMEGGPLELFSIVGGKTYTSDDTIDVIVNDNADALIFRIFAILYDLTSLNRS